VDNVIDSPNQKTPVPDCLEYRPMKRFAQLTAQTHKLLWGENPEGLPPWRRRLVLTLRMVYAVGRDIADGQLTLRAMSLVYTTLLSVVPLLALSFSVLKAFGVHNQVRPTLLALPSAWVSWSIRSFHCCRKSNTPSISSGTCARPAR